mmetsp:Transcript_20399/g.48603  ORF Transcript_20399/g.48603 Transcript_20399/m.48603 type:complete len:226 (+) Transcript_20399:718-1395(+)
MALRSCSKRTSSISIWRPISSCCRLWPRISLRSCWTSPCSAISRSLLRMASLAWASCSLASDAAKRLRSSSVLNMASSSWFWRMPASSSRRRISSVICVIRSSVRCTATSSACRSISDWRTCSARRWLSAWRRERLSSETTRCCSASSRFCMAIILALTSSRRRFSNSRRSCSSWRRRRSCFSRIIFSSSRRAWSSPTTRFSRCSVSRRRASSTLSFSRSSRYLR